MKHTKLLTHHVEGYEGFYEIDAEGNVYSVKHNWHGKGERILTPFPNNYGYMRVNLSKEGKRKTHFVHNLMCAVYLGKKNGLHVRHLDGNKANNCVANLKLGTAQENAADREKHGHTSRGNAHSKMIKEGISRSDSSYYRSNKINSIENH